MSSGFVVIIPTFRRVQLLRRLLLELSRQTCRPSGIIVVDGDPDSGEVLCFLKEFTPGGSGPISRNGQHHGAQPELRLWWLPSNHANLPFQRYVGFLAARKIGDFDYLVYLDDDLYPMNQTSIEKLLIPFGYMTDVSGVCGNIEMGSVGEACGGFEAVLLRTDRGAGRLDGFVRQLGAARGIAPGGLTVAGNRVPPLNEEYPSVSWLRGGAMAFRMELMSNDLFSWDLMALAEKKMGLGEDTILGLRLSYRGRLVWARDSVFLHPHDAAPSAYASRAWRFGYATSYSRRLILENFRYPDRPRPLDFLNLTKSWLGNILISSLKVIFKPRPARFSYLVGYCFGAVRGLFSCPSSSRLMPETNWDFDAKEAIGEIEEISIAGGKFNGIDVSEGVNSG